MVNIHLLITKPKEKRNYIFDKGKTSDESGGVVKLSNIMNSQYIVPTKVNTDGQGLAKLKVVIFDYFIGGKWLYMVMNNVYMVIMKQDDGREELIGRKGKFISNVGDEMSKVIQRND